MHPYINEFTIYLLFITYPFSISSKFKYYLNISTWWSEIVKNISLNKFVLNSRMIHVLWFLIGTPGSFKPEIKKVKTKICVGFI